MQLLHVLHTYYNRGKQSYKINELSMLLILIIKKVVKYLLLNAFQNTLLYSSIEQIKCLICTKSTLLQDILLVFILSTAYFCPKQQCGLISFSLTKKKNTK